MLLGKEREKGKEERRREQRQRRESCVQPGYYGTLRYKIGDS